MIRVFGCLDGIPYQFIATIEPYYTVIVTNSVTKENHVKLGLIDAMSCPKHDKNNKRKENLL